MSNDDEPTKDELEQRVDQLEQTVQRMMPSRRQTIKGLGLLGGGALLGGVGSQEAEAATGSAGNVGTSSDRPDVFADTVNSNQVGTTSNRFTGYLDTADANTVSTIDADVTGETYVELSLNSSKTGISALTLTNAFDTTDEDNLNEVNNSQQFSPDETGKYTVLVRVRFDPGADGDSCRLRLQNVTDGSLVDRLDAYNVGGSSSLNFLRGAWSGSLDSSKAYELQVQDVDNSFDIKAGSTGAEIIRGVVHP